MKYIALLLTSSLFMLSCSNDPKLAALKEEKNSNCDSNIPDTANVLINMRPDSIPEKVERIRDQKKTTPDFNIEYPHGGKQELRKRSDYDSSEWSRKMYYDSINRLKK